MIRLMIMRLASILALSSSVVALASNRVFASDPPRYRVEINDRPQQKRFVVALRSLDNRSLCIDLEKWPNRRGQLHFGSTWVKLDTSEGSYPARDENFGYCLGGCTIRIAPRSVLTGFIGYAQFGRPAAILVLKQRQLRFAVTPRVCKKNEWRPE